MIKDSLLLRSKVFRDIAAGAFLAVLVFLAYGNSLNHSFVWDDEELIVDSEHVQSQREWSGVLTRGFWDLGGDEGDDTRRFYRPVVSLSYMLDFRLWGLNPRGYHLTNLVLHAICAYLVYLLGIMILGGRLSGVLAAALFAVHPSHVENVSWISGRTDTLCALFFVPSFIFFLRWTRDLRSRNLDLVLHLLCFMMSLLAKETGITLLGVVVLHYIFVSRSRLPLRRFLFLLVSLVALSSAYISMRYAVLGDMSGQFVTEHWFIRVASIPVVFAKYLGVLLYIVPTDPHHSTSLVTHIWNLRFGLSLCICASYLLGMWLAWRFSKRKNLAFLLSWTPTVLIPVFNFGTFGDITHADRFLYVPSIGFAYLIISCSSQVCGLCKSRLAVRGVRIFLLSLIALSAARSSQTSSYWSDNGSLFARAVRTSPNSVHIRFNLANSYLNAKKYDQAYQEYARVIALEPDYEDAIVNMAFTAKQMKNYQDAIALFRSALALNSRAKPSFEEEVEKYRRRGMLLVAPYQELSDETYRRLARKRARAVYSQLGDIYRDIGDASAAIYNYTESLAHGDSYEPHHNLGAILLNAGQFDEAEKHLDRALALKCAPATLTNRGILASMRGDSEGAVKYLLDAIEKGSSETPPPNIVFVHYYLAKSYLRIGNADACRQHASMALSFVTKGYGSSEAVIADLHRYSTLASSSVH